MEKKVLTTPLRAEDLEDIHAGDIIYLSGHIVTCRDVAHRRLIEEGRKLPVDVRGGAIFHAGPIVRPIPGSDDRFEMVSVGPTTSMRMEKFEKEFIESGSSSERAAWEKRPWKDAGKERRFTVYSQPDVQSWPPPVSRRLRTRSGVTWECRRHSGYAESRNLAP